MSITLFRSFTIYLFRWETTSLVLAPILWVGNYLGWPSLLSVIISNFIGACLYFYPDTVWIFKRQFSWDFVRQRLWRSILRWETSTIVLWPVVLMGSNLCWGEVTSAVIANAVGALVFYWVDHCLVYG